MYVFTHGSKLRKFAIAILEIGAKVIKSEVEIVNQATIGLDLILFGEPVPITDIFDIAQNLGFKADNIKNVKDHVFYNEHDLDRYGPDRIERKQFDPNLQQALAWKRLETETHTQEDTTWIKHECAERHHELKYDSGYSEAHDRAQSYFDGAPWEDTW